jgi:hypothetical protein
VRKHTLTHRAGSPMLTGTCPQYLADIGIDA